MCAGIVSLPSMHVWKWWLQSRHSSTGVLEDAKHLEDNIEAPCDDFVVKLFTTSVLTGPQC